MTLDEYIEILKNFAATNDCGNLPVVDTYDNQPNTPEIVENAVVLADTY